MGKFFTRERFGHPQIVGASLLLIFLAQCGWLLLRGTSPLDVDAADLFRVDEGLRQWHGGAIAGTPSPERLEAPTPPSVEIERNQGFDPNHSPLWYLLASTAFTMKLGSAAVNSTQYWGWLARVPYVIFGVLLGASLWYVSRRLYGNAGGYIALSLYCFSPLILRNSTLWMTPPEIGAAGGAFGAIFTAIAVSHTLYAPREVVVWNRRRILLLGLSIALAVGCQFSLAILLPLTLAFMLYVASTRRLAAFAIWASSMAVALLVLFASYSFQPGIFWHGIRHAGLFPFSWQALTMRAAYQHASFQLIQGGPALLIAFPLTLAVYIVWRRARYFGNTAPLLVGALFVILGLATPHDTSAGFELAAIPFFFVFVSGVIADLLETRQRALVMACVWGVLTANALLNFTELARLGRG